MTQKIKAELPNNQNRIETGSLQINDDFTGTFIRGDNAAYYAMGIRHAQKLLEESGQFDLTASIALESLRRHLESSDERD